MATDAVLVDDNYLDRRIASPRLLLGVTVASPGMLPAALDRIALLRRQTALRFVECKRWK